ncbi:MAG TPA: DinB family protein [Streptosporangiaceae bacterium]|nr:DinB family protein [Streptosporangiaceae bacterium]
MNLDWNAALADQLDWQWQNHLRLRLDGLTDEEYFWEPVPGCWSLRKRGASTAPMAVGTGDYVMEYAYPEPEIPPVTTIAWRLAHVIVAVFGTRNASHFGGPATEYRTFDYAGTAAQALDQLDDAYATWIKGVRGLGAEGLARPCGPAEGPYAASPLAELVLHINREALHHGAEIALLRDLYRGTGTHSHAL